MSKIPLVLLIFFFNFYLEGQIFNDSLRLMFQDGLSEQDDITKIVFNEKGDVFGFLQESKNIYIYSSSGKKLSHFKAENFGDYILDFNFSPNGKYLLTIHDQKIIFWETFTNRKLFDLTAINGKIVNDKLQILIQEKDSTNSLVSVVIDENQEVKIFKNSDLSYGSYLLKKNDSKDFFRREIIAVSIDKSIVIKKTVNDGIDEIVLVNKKKRKSWKIGGRQNYDFERVNAISLQPRSNFVLTGGTDGTICCWSVNNGELLFEIQNKINEMYSPVFLKKSERVIQLNIGNIEDAFLFGQPSARHQISIWNVKDGKVSNSFFIDSIIDGGGLEKPDFFIDENDSLIVFSTFDGDEISCKNLFTGEVHSYHIELPVDKYIDFIGPRGGLRKKVVISQGSILCFVGDELFRAKSGNFELITKIKNYTVGDFAEFICFGKVLAISNYNHTIRFFSSFDGKLIDEINYKGGGFFSDMKILKSKDNYLIVKTDNEFTYLKRKSLLTDYISQNLMFRHQMINDSLIKINSANYATSRNPKYDYWNYDFCPEKNIFLKAKPKSIDIKSRKDNSLIYSRISFTYDNYIILLPNSPYYMCSKDASKMLHYVTPSLKVIGFEQLDPIYNRPDIVLDSIGKYFGGADQELIASYRQSWEKRIDRLGLDKEKLGEGEISVPNAEIVGADEIAYENKNGKLKIKVAANDPKYPLRRFNVYINEVPLYGSAGISIASLKKQEWDTTLSVPLSTGENKIQVSVMNELGLENFKYPSYVNYTPAETITAKTYYIGIGVNEFKESNHNLKYCVKDVSDLAKSFGGQNTVVKLFTNEQVTKENIVALKDYLSKTSVNDKVIISCSSHGLLDDSLNFYLAMHDVDFNNPKVRGLKYEELENLLDGIPARQKLLLLDACNSGENDKTDLLKKELKEAEKQKENEDLIAYKGKTKGIIIKLEEENQNKFRKVNELFVNVRNNTGSVIISAAGGQQSALEAIEVDGKIIKNGTFTFSVLEYLNNHNNKKEELTVNKLKKYVEGRVEEITKGKQKPTSRQETMEVDWQLKQ